MNPMTTLDPDRARLALLFIAVAIEVLAVLLMLAAMRVRRGSSVLWALGFLALAGASGCVIAAMFAPPMVDNPQLTETTIVEG